MIYKKGLKMRRSEIMKVHCDFKRLVDELSVTERTSRVELTRTFAKNFKKNFDKGSEETLFG
jgi:hypothetical protein